MDAPLTRLDGRWQMVRAEWEGEAAPDLVVRHTELELARGEYVVRFERRIADRGTFAVEANTIVLRGSSGANAGRTIPCLFQQVGERLRICFGMSGVLPTQFSTAPGQQRYLATYRRIAAAEASRG